MDDDLKEHLTASETWIRGLFILLFIFLLVIARVVTGAVVMVQFLFTVFSGQTNDNLRFFGASLALFVYQGMMFVTYNTDDKPFPFAPWPTPTAFDEPVAQADVSASSAEKLSAANDESDESDPRS